MEVYTLYVFSSKEYGGKGNEAIVIHSKEEILRDAVRQDIAREKKAPITCFINNKNNNIYYHGVATKLPFCIHGTLAASKILLDVLKKEVHTIRISAEKTILIQKKQDLYQITTNGIKRFDETINKNEIAELLETKLENLGTPEILSIGSKKCLIPIKNHVVLNELTPNFEGIKQWSKAYKTNGFYLYTNKPLKDTINFQTRSFNPLSGNNEDLATGVAAALIPWKENIDNTLITVGQGVKNSLNKINVFRNKKEDQTLISGKVKLKC